MDLTLESVKSDSESILNQLSSLSPSSDDYITLSKQLVKLNHISNLLQNKLDIEKEIQLANEFAQDPSNEIGVFAAELVSLNKKLSDINSKLELLTLSPLDDDDSRSIMEIRAGTGGAEAAIFVADLLRMYLAYFKEVGLSAELADINYAEGEGIKNVTIFIETPESFKQLRFEGGVHRVQRVPKTETAGRIHTSAASVVVMPQANKDDHSELINDNDIRIDVYRSSGPGGQSVNTTDSAVRVTHIPSGIVVTCQDSKSQLKNKEQALKILAAKLQQIAKEKQAKLHDQYRQIAIKSGDRSDKIRTYNFPQSRLTDHRINESWYNLEEIMEGKLAEVIAKTQEFMRRK